MRYLIHDRDRKITKSFDQIFHSEGSEVVLTPFRAPTANAIVERWVCSVREECLDQLLIVNQRHLMRVLREYTDYYNTARPHQGLNQLTPIPIAQIDRGAIHRRAILGGILHDYYRSNA